MCTQEVGKTCRDWGKREQGVGKPSVTDTGRLRNG